MENDMIRRSDAISQSFPVTFSNGLEPYDVDVVAVGHIKSVPAVDAVEVVHSNWGKSTAVAECMNCRSIFPAFLRWHEWCPNCGARMDGRRADGDA